MYSCTFGAETYPLPKRFLFFDTSISRWICFQMQIQNPLLIKFLHLISSNIFLRKIWDSNLYLIILNAILKAAVQSHFHHQSIYLVPGPNWNTGALYNIVKTYKLRISTDSKICSIYVHQLVLFDLMKF